MDYNQPIPLYQSKPTYSIIIKQELPWQTSTNHKPEPKPDYIPIAGESLTLISEAQKVPLDRLWRANPQLKHPDLINVGEPLKIPLDSDVLPDRPLPAMISTSQSLQASGTAVTGGSSSSGMFDTTGGWCTNYAARRHPVPASFRNADTWLIDARNAGLSTGSTPQVGAIAVAARYMHVAIVEQIDGNRVYISEQNYVKYGEVDYRWTDISEWQGYVY